MRWIGYMKLFIWIYMMMYLVMDMMELMKMILNLKSRINYTYVSL